MSRIERGSASNPGAAILSSDWTGLSEHLLAKIYPVQRVVDLDAVRWQRIPGSVEVRAPLTDCTIDQSINWQSPFEHQTADAKIATLSALFQSGAFLRPLAALQEFVGRGDGAGNAFTSAAAQRLQSLAGKSAVTKLNSAQIFSGMPPVKIAGTLHFRALVSPISEVRQPMDQIMQWALPQALSSQGLFGNVVDTNSPLSVDTLYPSRTPQIVGLQYADSAFVPMVFESISQPLTGSRGSAGHLLHAAIAFTLGSLSALDKDDWQATRQ